MCGCVYLCFVLHSEFIYFLNLNICIVSIYWFCNGKIVIWPLDWLLREYKTISHCQRHFLNNLCVCVCVILSVVLLLLFIEYSSLYDSFLFSQIFCCSFNIYISIYNYIYNKCVELHVCMFVELSIIAGSVQTHNELMYFSIKEWWELSIEHDPLEKHRQLTVFHFPHLLSFGCLRKTIMLALCVYVCIIFFLPCFSFILKK